MVAEAAPLLPLLAELSSEARAGDDFESFSFRECFTVLSLLGRRLALLDLTPTVALQVVRLALRSVDGFDDRSMQAFAERAVDAATEGFVLGREERIAKLAEVRAAKHLHPLRIDDAAFALLLSGVHEPSVLSECTDALGRSMLAADIDIAIVDLSQLGEANRERATALFAADEVARMLGGTCVFTGIDPRWAAAAAEARISMDALHVAPNLAAAIDSARRMKWRSPGRTKPRWRALLDRFRS